MSVTLTSEQLSILQAHSDAGDRISYYSALEAFGVAYGGLALEVVLNNSIAGAAANAFLVSQALGGTADTNLLARIGTELMKADMQARLSADGADLTGTNISDYHARVFRDLAGANGEAWTPFNYLNTFERPDAFNAAWDELLNSGNWGTYALISTRRMTLLWEYQDTHPGTEGYTPVELETFDRDALLAAGFDAQFLDWFNQYTDYLHDLQRAGINGLDGASPYFSSNDYGNYVIANSSGQIIGGDAGSDGLSGGSGDDVVMGFSGDDTIAGSAGNDRIYGNGGSDLVDYGGERGPLRIELGTMQDAETARLFGPMASDWSIQRVVGENDADILVDIERITATSGDDTLSFSGDFEDILQGDAVAYGGINLGGEGDAGDTLDLSLLSGSAFVLLGDGRAEIYDGWTPSSFATVLGAENIIGTEFSDDIQGNQEANLINGGAGADILRGGAGGNDTLVGGAGADRLYYVDGVVTLEGGEGNDYYDFSEVTGTDRGATIVLSGDFGHDMMSDRGYSMDRLVFSDVNFADVSFSYDYTVSGPYSSGYDTYWLSGALTITVDADNSFYIPYVGGQYVYSQGDWWTPEGYFSAYLQSPFTIEFADRSFDYWERMFDVPVWQIPQASTPETAATALDDHEAERADESTGGDGSTDGDDLIHATAGNDTINARAGNDTVLGYGGNDQISGGAGNDSIDGGDGNDTLSGDDALGLEGPDDDVVSGGAGDDVLNSFSGSDTLLGGDGNDILFASFQQSSAVDLLGGSGSDTIFAHVLGGVIDAGAGDDLLNLGGADGANASITLGAGADRLNIFDALSGSTGTTGSGAFALTLEDFVLGEDEIALYQELSNDAMPIGAELFRLTAEGTTAVLTTSTGGRITLANITAEEFLDTSQMTFEGIISGTIDANKLAGTTADDVISAGAGNDRVAAGAGDDLVFGGDGNDQLIGNAGDDTIFGGAGDDILQGNTGHDVLIGGDGNDTIYAGNDASVVDGGAGADVITLQMQLAADHQVSGGAGADTFNFVALKERLDAHLVITDYELGVDQVYIEATTLERYWATHTASTCVDTDEGALLILAEGDSFLFKNVLAADLVADLIAG